MNCPVCQKPSKRLIYDRCGKRCLDCNNPNFIRALSLDTMMPLLHELKGRREPNTITTLVNPDNIPTLEQVFAQHIITPHIRTMKMRSIPWTVKRGVHVIEDHTKNPVEVTVIQP